jgi:hypothetical protein
MLNNRTGYCGCHPYAYISLLIYIFLENLQDPLETLSTLKTRWARPCWFRLLGIVCFSVAMMMYWDQKQHEKEVYLAHTAHDSPSQSGAKAGAQGRSLKHKPQSSAAYWLALHSFLVMLFDTNQSHLPRDARVHGGLDTPTSRKFSTDVPQASLIETSFQLRFLLPRWV